MVCRYDFVLIDLYSQREAVLRYVENWTKAEILRWFREKGVVELHPFMLQQYGREEYSFNPYSCPGLWGSFHFTEEGVFSIPRIYKNRMPLP